MTAYSMVIVGKVQGVFFRTYAKQVADRLGLKGWVKNMGDGSVSVHAEGETDTLKEFEEWCRRGPPSAKVEDVRCDAAEEEGYKGFYIRQ
ncbi:MAG: acylphosphatase [Candidatus Peribacteraceae bacterium]|jgi:acylphosphatase